ncbi:hypothetical protein [uncultured Helicobacter sp.]|uniref:hypothetical protein n=1 Tax=uncultured Helicobacter sp. TaxID=175537 RepID=UPI00374F2DAD
MRIKIILAVVLGVVLIGCGDSKYTKETKLKHLKDDAFQAFYGMPEYNSNNDFDKKVNELVEAVMQENNIPQELKQNFTNCIHYTLWSKSPEVTLDIPIRSCVGDYNNNILQSTIYFNPSFVMGNFNTFDGSNALVERRVKDIMNDSGSYKHIKTIYAVRGSENPQNVTITTEFSGKNAFGGVVKHRLQVKLDSNGKVLSAEDL